MPISLLEYLRADREDRKVEPCAARNEELTLEFKFRCVNLSIWAEPLGFCYQLIPEVEYAITRLERVGRTIIFVHFVDPVREYLLPRRYANMASQKDIERINSG